MPRPITFTRPDQRVIHMTSWSEADLDDLAVITDADIDAARRYWLRIMPRRFRDLLDATSTVAAP